MTVTQGKIQVIGFGGAGCSFVNYAKGTNTLVNADLHEIEDNDPDPNLDNSQLIVLVGGLGGQNVPARISNIATLAKQQNIPVAGLFIIPFQYEGKRYSTALEDVKKLTSLCNWHAELDNTLFASHFERNFGLIKIFKAAHVTMLNKTRELISAAMASESQAALITNFEEISPTFGVPEALA